MKKNYDGIEFFMEDMAEFVKAEPAGLLMLETLLKTSADGGGQHMLRQFAMPIGNSQALIDQNFEDGAKEHVWPANKVGLLILQAVKYNKVPILASLLRDNYYMIGITETEDGKLIDNNSIYGEKYDYTRDEIEDTLLQEARAEAEARANALKKPGSSRKKKGKA